MNTQPRTLARAGLVPFVAGVLVTLVIAVTAPVHAQPIKPDFWGMHDSDWASQPRVTVGSANLTTAATYWHSIQTGRRSYNWTRLDAQVAGAEAIGAQPLIVLGKTPKFASTRPRSAYYDDHMPRVRPWRSYVAKVARKYGHRLDYQIWPEPNIIQNWRGTPRQMARLTMVAAKAINRHAGKRAKVVSPAFALRLNGQQRWMVDYFKKQVGGKRVHRYVDVIAIDPFPEQRGTPEDALRLMRSARKQLARVGVRRPFWVNEINYGVAGGGDSTGTRYSVDKQQSYVIRTYVLSAAARMRRTYWLGWFSTSTMAVKMAAADGSRRPPGKSYEIVRSWLNQTNFQGCTRRRGLWVCTARQSRSEVRRIYWDPSGRTRIKTSRSTTFVENQEGDRNPRNGARRIRVTFRPIMVASRR